MAVGTVVGWVGAWAVTRLVSSLLYGVTLTDPVTFAGVTALLAVVARASCWLPGCRASGADPAEALRSG